ncbi:tRNA glutamyl-Q(34) synthetase GluQRS [Breoghania sp. L-A4]|uniref:tRNA glutamyl-Q(34) synthetase GluQRS n=1 Tax=Breoghania sp. L-A4 TaxID=2304600 RepID=UPI000E3603F9|nr:tRNA glutamyl-Q(34) synthetase GluQRS [Breoghania sp. L-A4]AXS42338.1 tRNA glutamyl-Q(34) synthetase GluQRS [Breoghania sp. L-A4]
MPVRPVFRFAPSPNGPLHLGHAYSALLNADMARAAEGRLLLRLEDIDVTRCRPDFETAIYEDLAWLGLDWEQPVRRQSEFFGDFTRALQLLDDDALIYRSYPTRGEIRAFVETREAAGETWPRDPDGAPLFPGDAAILPEAEIARRLREDAPYALRLDMAGALARVGRDLAWNETGVGPDGDAGTVAARPELWGDVVLARKDVATSYHLSVVVDDALQGITHVVRGRDLFAATSVHRVLQALLDLPAPVYHHHRLILDADGGKLSKSAGAASLASLRADGATPGDIRRMVGL